MIDVFVSAPGAAIKYSGCNKKPDKLTSVCTCTCRCGEWMMKVGNECRDFSVVPVYMKF